MSAIFQDLNSRQEYRSNFSFYILQNVFFLVDVRKKSKDFLSSVLLLRSEHCLKSYKSALIDGINNARLMKAKKQTNKHQMQHNYSSLPVEMQLVKAFKQGQNR